MPPDPGSATGSRHRADLTTRSASARKTFGASSSTSSGLSTTIGTSPRCRSPTSCRMRASAEKTLALSSSRSSRPCWGASRMRSKGTTRPSRRRSRGAAVLGRAPETQSYEVTCLSDRLTWSLAERALRGEGPLCSGLHRHLASGSRTLRRRHASWRAAQASPTEGADTTSGAPKWCGRPGDRQPGRLRYIGRPSHARQRGSPKNSFQASNSIIRALRRASHEVDAIRTDPKNCGHSSIRARDDDAHEGEVTLRGFDTSMHQAVDTIVFRVDLVARVRGSRLLPDANSGGIHRSCSGIARPSAACGSWTAEGIITGTLTRRLPAE